MRFCAIIGIATLAAPVLADGLETWSVRAEACLAGASAGGNCIAFRSMVQQACPAEAEPEPNCQTAVVPARIETSDHAEVLGNLLQAAQLKSLQRMQADCAWQNNLRPLLESEQALAGVKCHIDLAAERAVRLTIMAAT